MSFNGNSSFGFESNENWFDSYVARVFEQNLRVNCMIEEVVNGLTLEDPPPRARRRYRDKQHEAGETQLIKDYFDDHPTYDDMICRRRFHMRRHVFTRMRRLLFIGDQRGFPGSLNDINVLHRSPVFNDVLVGEAPKVSYIVNGNEHDTTYYLTNDIYPSWDVFVKSITSPHIRKHKLFAQHQEASGKDVERAFGVLQARFAFIRRPCLVWDNDKMRRIMIACIIIHNMIVEDERDTYQNYFDPTEFMNDIPTNQHHGSSTNEDDQPFGYSTERIASLSSYMVNREQLRNRQAHIALKNDLIEHI